MSNVEMRPRCPPNVAGKRAGFGQKLVSSSVSVAVGAGAVNHVREAIQGVVLEADAGAGEVGDVGEVAQGVVGVVRGAHGGARPADEPSGFVKC